jgi:hypothetical protein
MRKPPPGRPLRLRHGTVLACLALAAGCASGLPGGRTDPVPGPSGVPGVGHTPNLSGAAWNAVRFEVTCGVCLVTYEAGRVRGRDDVQGSWQRDVRPGGTARVIRLMVRPEDLTQPVQFARILVDGVVRAEHRGRPAEGSGVVHLAVDLTSGGQASAH